MDPRGVCIKRPFPAEQPHSSMFSCAKSGPLSGSGCEGKGKQSHRHKLTAKGRPRGGGGRSHERMAEKEKKGREEKGKFGCVFVCLVKWRNVAQTQRDLRENNVA
ncbi:unnamed protein product [Pleuronectes platessa]|uniref:Uncharacterized protein n=1 Tax=Pleuronectes platessa TaxID=8262 RepID=A0A9N7VS64_PLEPL|nr:unnamed protein product [Pleuronectes platessa]